MPESSLTRGTETVGSAAVDAGESRPKTGEPGRSENDTERAAVALCRRVAGDERFQNLILAVIVANAVVIGIETSSAARARFGAWTDAFNLAAQVIFTLEIAIRLTAYWPRPLQFFRGGWNVFDFLVVGIAYIPATAGLSNLARLARVARATRLVSALPELRLVFETILRSLPSMTHILVLLTLFLYVYGIAGVHLFGDTDPERWGSLGVAILTLFQVLTLEGWPDVWSGVSGAHRWSWIYFTSFIVGAVWVVTNLFVAVILSNLQAAKQADVERIDSELPGRPLARITEVRQALARLERDIRKAHDNF